MTAAVMVSWAIAVVGEFDDAGRRIPDSMVPLLPMVDVVLWAREQPQPLRLEALQSQFHLSRATAYRWLLALQDLHDPATARRRIPSIKRIGKAIGRELPVAAHARGQA